jgi:hypothetical protein
MFARLFTASLFVALVALALAKSVPNKAPDEWKARIKNGLFLYDVKEPRNTALMASGVFLFLRIFLPLLASPWPSYFWS